MRVMVRWTVPVEKGNQAIADGSLRRTLAAMAEKLKPEASYFYAEDGKRAGMMVIDMTDSSQIPQIAEPLFSELDASVQFVPVMNADDLRKAIG